MVKKFGGSGKNSMSDMLPLPSKVITVFSTVCTFLFHSHFIDMGKMHTTSKPFQLNGFHTHLVESSASDFGGILSEWNQ